ncbi:MAG: DNA repair and recombination protein RadB [Methanospirillaceae archaeon]|nr:DNA repair and recombination protein RadB [Methanospirillaceae archaeon]
MNRSSVIPIGCNALDDLIGGGLAPRIITQLYGESATAKSTICMMAAIAVLRQGRAVIYFDTESFSIERFAQIAGDDAKRLGEEFYLYEPADFDQQGSLIRESDSILASRNPGIVILDSATGLYRTELEHKQDTMQRLNRQMVFLLGMGKRYDIPVLITNQVYVDLQRSDFAPLGGTGLMHISKIIIRIDRLHDSAVRRATLMKHSSQPEGGTFDFIITGTGIAAIKSEPPSSGDLKIG